MEIDIELSNFGSQCVSNFPYIVGDPLFDVITYPLDYSQNLTTINRNSIFHSQECLNLGTPKASKCWKLNM
jgi:hypothetical protein